MENMKLIQILWDYMRMNHELKKSDCIIGLGTIDTNVANVASDLYLNGYARKLIFSGGLGKITYKYGTKLRQKNLQKLQWKKEFQEKIYI